MGCCAIESFAEVARIAATEKIAAPSRFMQRFFLPMAHSQAWTGLNRQIGLLVRRRSGRACGAEGRGIPSTNIKDSEGYKTGQTYKVEFTKKKLAVLEAGR